MKEIIIGSFGVALPEDVDATALGAFIKREFSQPFHPLRATFSPTLQAVTMVVGLDEDAAKAEVLHLVEVWLRQDMLPQAEVAKAVGISLLTLNQAVKDGRLRSYRNANAANPRRGRRVVSLKEARELWS